MPVRNVLVRANSTASATSSTVPMRPALWLDDERLHREPGQTVVAHGIDRGLDADEPVRHAARTAR